ncbi:hypothetical protein [Sphingobacterium sp. FBM7-1]|nr:hypothetical protein [Sphingobacterium sp. FBM7-1]MCC2599878.1 hypothetical protein [Sphingobacterium sp. FBM7-1]
MRRFYPANIDVDNRWARITGVIYLVGSSSDRERRDNNGITRIQLRL